MAKLSSYTKDTSITEKDKLAGSSYVGLVNGIPKYQTASYTIEDLGTYFSENITVGGQVYDIETIYNDLERTKTYTLGLQEEFWSANEDGSLDTFSVAFANQVFSVTTSTKFATSQYVTNLGTSFGEFDASGNLVTLAEAFANQVFTTTTSSKFATSEFVTNLGSSVGTLNEDGTLASLSEAFANSVITTTTSDKFATSSFVTNLGSSVGTLNTDGTLASLSEAFANQVFTTTSSDKFATSQYVNNLGSSVGTLNTDGTLASLSQSFANQVFTTTSSDKFAESTRVNTLGATLGVYDANGDTIIASNAAYLETVTTYVDAQSVTASRVGQLNSVLNILGDDGIATVTSAEYLNSVTTYVDENSATANRVEGLNSTLNLLDENGDAIYTNAEYLTNITTYVDDNSATASKVYQLNLTLNILDVDGNATVTNAEYLESITTHVDENSASAAIARGLNTELGITDEEGVVVKTKAQFDEEITQYVDENSVTASKVRNLNSTLDLLDVNGGAIYTNAQYLDNITTYVDTNAASAKIARGINAEFGITDESGITTKTKAQFDEEITNYVDENSATAGKVNNLGAAFGEFNGETFSISEAKITEELNTYTDLNFSESTYFQDIESNISGKPSVYRQNEEPTISAGPPQVPANGSIWYDTSESNKVYILTAGVWTLTDDSRIGATASKVTNMSAAFGTFDENNNFTIDGDASYGEAIVLKVDTDSATAAKIENLGAELGVFDGNNNFSTSFSADFKTAVNNEVDANSSTAGYVSNLSAAVGIDKEDGSTLQASASVNGNNTGTTTTATVDVAVEGSKTIQLVDNISNELIEVGQYVTFESSTWLYAIDDVWRVAEYSDTTNIVVLDKEVSLGEGDTLTFKGKSVIAVDGVSGVIREGFQVRGEGITVGTFVSDYTAPNLTLSRAEVLADDTVLEFLGIYAAVTETAKVLADIDGNLKASWGMQVDANGNIAGMKLLADNTGSGIIFNADTFKIYNTADTTGVAPFEVKDGTVKIKSANIGDISFGDLDDIPDTFISTVIYADDINGTNPSTTKGSKNFFAIYQANVVWEDGDALPEGLTFSQMKGDTGEQGPTGEPGETGATGFRVYNTNLYYQSVVTDNTTPTFDDSGLEYNFSTNSFGSTIPSGWAINPPSTAPGSGSNKYYYVPINIIEGTPNQIVVGAVTSYFNFSGLVTFTGGGTTISDGENEFDYTAIDGAWITTGAIKSQNFEYTDTNGSLSFNESEAVTDGTIFNLVDGYLKTPTLWLKSDGDALFTGDITGATGTFTGKLFAALGTNSVVNPDAYVAFGNVEVSNVGATVTKNFPVLELSDDFRAIQARRAIYINTVLDDAQEFTGIRFFGTRLDENGDEDLANKGLSIKADEIELRYFNHPDDYVPTKFKWADKSIIDGPTYKTEIYAEWNDTDKPYIVIDADVRFTADVDLGTGQIVGHPDINAGTSTSNAAGTSTVIKNIDLDSNGHVLDIENISLTLDNITDAGNTTDNNIFVNNVIGDAFIFDTANPEAALSVGGATWNNTKGTLNLHVKEGVYYRVNQQTFFYGKATEAISKGQVVMFAGVQGSHVLIAKADMNAAGFIPEYVIGVAAEDFTTNEFGHVIEFGELIGFDTTDFEDGDLLYLDPATPGGYVTTEPDSSDGHSILIAAVINTQNATNGGIIVRPSHKVGIDELHDVDVTGKTAGDMLVYNDVDEKWVAKNELTDLKLYGKLTGPATFIIDPAIVDSDEGTVEIRGSIDVNGNGNFDGNVVIDGDLTVSGAIVTISATNLAVQDNMIYLNQGSTVSNPDLGFAGNYNDGTYAHAGLFRDATDGIWKFFKNYVPEPDDLVYINTAHETFALADVQAASFTGNLSGNVIGNVQGDLTGTASNATNADKVDDKHATDFTLDYVISNNHVTNLDVTMADISADNIDLGGSLVVDGTINGKTTIKGDFNSLNTTGFVIAKLGVSGAINNELFTITVFGTGYYQKTVFSCTHPGTPTTDWSTWISINEGDDIFLISPSNVNNELVLTLKASQVISDLGGSYFIEHIGNELIKV